MRPHNEKGLMNDISGTVKTMVYRKVMSNNLVINHPSKFATLADDNITNIESLYLSHSELPEKPENTQNAIPIPDIVVPNRMNIS